jgi:predicted ribosomally synthesized peptide with SipW-like signal peptide
MRSRPPLRRIAAASLGAAAVAVIGTGATTALLTDSEDIANNTIEVGTIDLVADAASVGPFNVSGMLPGDVVYKPFTVANAGDSELRYSVLSIVITGGYDLAGLLDLVDLEVRSVAAAANCNDAGWGAGIDAASGVRDFGGMLPRELIGYSAPGQDPDDRVLAGGASEVLCFRVTLPLMANGGDLGDGNSMTAQFTFDAEQTGNNP